MKMSTGTSANSTITGMTNMNGLSSFGDARTTPIKATAYITRPRITRPKPIPHPAR